LLPADIDEVNLQQVLAA